MLRNASLWLLLILSVLTMPAMAGTSVAELSDMAEFSDRQSQLQHGCFYQEFAQQDLQPNQAAIPGQSSVQLDSIKKTSAKHYSLTQVLWKIKQFSQDIPTDAGIAPDYSLLREISQHQPEYLLETEFNPPDPALKSFSDHRYASKQLPWYLTASPTQRLRPGAWKDSNIQYRANLSFHL